MATDPTPATGPSWSVTGQAERTIINAQGNAEDVMQVSFQLADGTQGTVNVPLRSYTAENVAAAIKAKAATLDAVANLTN